MIEVLSTGAPNVVQDLGRTGYLSIGVCRSGAMDPLALSLANALVGNEEGAAGIEVSLFPFKLRFQVDTTFACTGTDSVVRLDDVTLAPWWRRPARAGQTIVIERPKRGARAYLAIGGGIDALQVMGSRSTDLKSGFGGWEGRGLRRGDILPLGSQSSPILNRSGLGVIPQELPEFWRELASGVITLRVLPAAEFELFTQASRAAFTECPYLVTPEANRVGYRLAGESLQLAEPLELLSHGIVPGTVQVPPSGQPIIQLAEANTCGGYPKIATVIEADLWRVAQAPVGCSLRFKLVDQVDALAAWRTQVEALSKLRANLALMIGRG